MQIQPVGTTVASRTEDRPAQAVEQQEAVAGVAGKPAGSATPVSRETLGAAVKKLNESMPASAQSLEFSIDDDSKDIVVKVIDQSTKEVVRQIPSEEALALAKSLDKMRGLLIRQTA